MLRSIGPTEWVVIVILVVVLFGGKKIPQLMKGMAQGIKEWKAIKQPAKETVEELKNQVS